MWKRSGRKTIELCLTDGLSAVTDLLITGGTPMNVEDWTHLDEKQLEDRQQRVELVETLLDECAFTRPNGPRSAGPISAGTA